jgi:hypothetical protein
VNLKGSQAPSVYLLDENSATLHYSLAFNRSNPYNRIFNKKIDQLISGGLVLKFEQIRTSYHRRQPKQEDSQEPQILTVQHLEICFIAIMICLGLSCLVFMIEFVVGLSNK